MTKINRAPIMKTNKCIRLQKGAAMITIYDIAKELHISASTVSRTFSNPGLVSEKTRKRVLEKAEEMGYQVNMVASQLRNKTSNIIALVSLQEEWSWFTDVLANGVQDEAWKAGYEIVMLNGNSKHLESLSICEKMRFAGIIVASTELGTDRVYANEVIPVVYVNRMIEDQFRILPDDRHGVGLAMQYLKKMGHTDIGFINGPESSIHSGIRFRAYLEKMHEFGFPVQDRWIQRGDWKIACACQCMRKILDSGSYPTALLVANDQMCVGVYKAMQERGLHPGRDISVIGYDNMEYSEWMFPTLTTVSMPLYEMGKAAGRMILDRIRGKEEEKEVIVRGNLIVRHSVCPCKK